MPEQVRLGHAHGKAVIQDALEILGLGIFFVGHLLLEERRRRHLLGIANDDRFLTSGNDTDSLTRRQLARLIENDQIEHRVARRRDKLRHGHRTHENTRSDVKDEPLNAGKKRSYRDIATLALDGFLQSAEA